MNPDEASDRAGPDREHLEHRQLLRRVIGFDTIAWREFWKLGAGPELGMGPRVLFEKLVSHMSVDRLEAFPSQPLLAQEIPTSVRSVERWTAVLVKLGIINEPRVLRARGVLHYELGPAAYAAIREYVAQHPTPARLQDHDARDRIEQLEQRLAEATASRENAAVALFGQAAAVRIRCTSSAVPTQWRVDSRDTSQPATTSTEVNSLPRLENASSSSVPREEQESISISEDDKSAARSALGTLNAKRFPGRPTFIVVAELVLAARCAALIDGLLEDKRAALQRAIDGACLLSKGAPTAKFVFADAAHFRDHLARAAKKPKPRELEPIAPVELVDAATVLADVAELFGPQRVAAGGT